MDKVLLFVLTAGVLGAAAAVSASIYFLWAEGSHSSHAGRAGGFVWSYGTYLVLHSDGGL